MESRSHVENHDAGIIGCSVLVAGISLLPGPAQAQKQEAVKSKATNEALAELGKAQIEVAEAQMKVAESLMQEAEVAIQIAETDRKVKMDDLQLMQAKQAAVSPTEVAEAKSAVEKRKMKSWPKRLHLGRHKPRWLWPKPRLKWS
jgi:hypothetical protein